MAGKSRAAAAAIVVVVVAAAAGFGGAAYASHQFEDVPDSYPFHDDIDRIAEAGITTGFPDGTYRPGGTVTRGAMAAFMGRGFSRVASTYVENVAIPTSPGSTVASVTIDPGATDGGHGYLVVEAVGTATFGSGCPCYYASKITGGAGPSPFLPGVAVHSDHPLNLAVGPVVAHGVFQVAGGAPVTLNLSLGYLDDDATAPNLTNLILTATYVPFSGEPPT